jgi:hypothetical protein
MVAIESGLEVLMVKRKHGFANDEGCTLGFLLNEGGRPKKWSTRVAAAAAAVTKFK